MIDNVGTIDRAIRGVLGVILVPMLVIGPVPGWGLIGLLGITFLFTAAIGWCPLYMPFGISTADGEAKPE